MKAMIAVILIAIGSVAYAGCRYYTVTQGGRTAVVNSEGEKLSILDLGLVTAIELNSPNGG